MSTILGLDLSLTATGMIALPLSWCGDWSKLSRAIVGEKPPRDSGEAWRIGRLVRLANEVVDFAREHDVCSVFVEAYGFNASKRGSAITGLAELGGVVKHQLVTQLGLVAESVPVSSARKTLMGSCPRADAKITTRIFLRDVGIPSDWGPDEADAFVIANHGASLLGGWAMVTEPVKRRRAA